jgi:hypothetical protein
MTACVLATVACAVGLPVGLSSNDTEKEALLAIANPNISEKELVWQLNHLGQAQESASFWIDIVNDSKYSTRHRGYCLVQFFRRHVHAGMPLGQLAASLERAPWLREDHVYEFFALAGFVPVDWPIDCSLFSVAASSDQPLPIYLCLERPITKAQLVRALHGEPVAKEFLEKKISDAYPKIGAPSHPFLEPGSK